MAKVISGNAGAVAFAGIVLFGVGIGALFIRPSYGLGYLGLSIAAFVLARILHKRDQRQ